MISRKAILLQLFCLLLAFNQSWSNEAAGPSDDSDHSGPSLDCKSDVKSRSSPNCYVSTCTHKISGQIAKEFEAAFQYLVMAAYFDQERVARPGLAKEMYAAASEERQHAISMLEYLDRRGVLLSGEFIRRFKNGGFVGELRKKFSGAETEHDTYKKALEKAYKLEVEVTKSINEVVTHCANDYDGADFFTNPILAEQFDGMRKLKAAINTLQDLKHRHSGVTNQNSDNLAEFILDQRFLKGNI